MIIIAKADAADLASIQALRVQWGEENGFTVEPDFEDRLHRWFDRERPRREFWIAYEHDMPIGFVNLVILTRMPNPGRPASSWGYLNNMYIAQSHRSRGIGTQLLDAVLEFADQAGLAHVLLHPLDTAFAFYQRAGFSPADEFLLRRSGRR